MSIRWHILIYIDMFPFYKTLIFLLFLFIPFSSQAGTAFPYPVKVKTTSGYAYITMCGDENNKYALTSDGYSVAQSEIGWRYLYRDDEGMVLLSDYGLEEIDNRSKELQTFLASVEKGLKPMSGERTKRSAADIYSTENNIHKSPVIGRRKVLVVMMQFTDKKFSKSKSEFENLFNQQNYSADGASGSVRDYYNYVSYGQLELQCDILGPYTSKQKMEYYGRNIGFDSHDANPFALFEEALDAAAKDVDLSGYDSNGDGIVDNFHIIYAGYGEEAGALSQAIWAHESTFEAIQIGNTYIDRYSCAPELRQNSGEGISRIGPHCHEIGHALGAMDYYDTNYETAGHFSGTGVWDVMAAGSWNDQGVNPANFNAYVKAYDFGWSEVRVINTDTTLYVDPSSNSNVVYQLNTPVSGEFFLLENRQQVKFDKACPSRGLLIYHIGKDLPERVRDNTINSMYPQQCYIVCASSDVSIPTSQPSSYGDINTAGCPYPGTSDNHFFTQSTIPAALCYGDISANFSLTDIFETNNNRISISYTHGPEDDPKSINTSGEIVWHEDFSDGITRFWQQEHIQKNEDWVSSMIYNNGFIRIAELRANGTPWDSDEVFTKTALVAHSFDVEEGEYVLSLDYQNDNTRGIIDSLKVSIRQKGADQWTQIYKIPVTSKVWTTGACLIPRSYWPYELAIEGIVSKVSRLCISNLVLRKSVSTGISCKIFGDTFNENDPLIYNLSGNKREKMGKGLNIIKQKDGTFKKIVVK